MPEHYRVQPKLGDLVVSFNMHVGRFYPVTGVEKETIRAFPQDSRHFIPAMQELANLWDKGGSFTNDRGRGSR